MGIFDFFKNKPDEENEENIISEQETLDDNKDEILKNNFEL